MKTNSMILALVSSLTFAATGAAHAQDVGPPKRGTVLVDGQTAKAVVVGPVAIHAYSEFSGAKLFVATAVTGTDRDCAATGAARAAVAADKVETFTVGAGQIACVASSSARGIELLWHAQKSFASQPSAMFAAR